MWEKVSDEQWVSKTDDATIQIDLIDGEYQILVSDIHVDYNNLLDVQDIGEAIKAWFLVERSWGDVSEED